MNVWYKVGSRDEQVGKRGLAHLMEHMMYGGSRNFSPEEHKQIIDRAGGVWNAFATEDFTGFWELLPEDKLELALELESERMQNLVLTREYLDVELEVVREEYRFRTENDPFSRAIDRVRELALQGTPYAWSPGVVDDIADVTIADLQDFYATYYVPNNAVLIVAGDVKADRLFRLAEEHFGAIPSAPAPPAVKVAPPVRAALREETLQLAVQLPAVLGAYHIPGVGHKDVPALEVAGFILSFGESSLLNKSLVREKQLAVGAGAFPIALKDLGMMGIAALFTPDKDPHLVKDALLESIETLKDQPVGDRVLQKAKNQLTAQYIFNLDSLIGVASSIGTAEVIWGDYRLFLDAQDRYEDVTAADIQRVAHRYFRRDNLVLVTLTPGEESGP